MEALADVRRGSTDTAGTASGAQIETYLVGSREEELRAALRIRQALTVPPIRSFRANCHC